jgi:hypothetical protein
MSIALNKLRLVIMMSLTMFKMSLLLEYVLILKNARPYLATYHVYLNLHLI